MSCSKSIFFGYLAPSSGPCHVELHLLVISNFPITYISVCPIKLIQKAMKVNISILLFFAFVRCRQMSPDVGISFQPEFDCNGRCMRRIRTIFARTIKKIDFENTSTMEAVSAEAAISDRGRRSGLDSDQLCVEHIKRISWQKFIELDICAVVKQFLPQCRGRQDACITCYGNGTYGMYFNEKFSTKKSNKKYSTKNSNNTC